MCLSSNVANQLFVYLAPPPGSRPICLPGLRAWSHGSGPCQASLGHETACVEVCACIHLLRLRWAVWQITPDPPESAARVRIASVTDVEYVHTRAPTRARTRWCARIRPRVSGSIFISNRRVWPPTADITLHPLLSPISVFWTRWGARVTSDPPPLCDWWDSPALSPPPPLYCTLTGIWHSLGPFIKNTATVHLSFLISLPISLIL